MNQFENSEKKEQTIEESLNWISYNLKRIADILQQHTGYKKPQRDQNFENNNYRR